LSYTSALLAVPDEGTAGAAAGVVLCLACASSTASVDTGLLAAGSFESTRYQD